MCRGCSSVGRAPALQAGGHRFDPVHLHHFLGKRQTKVRVADFRLTFGQIAVSIFNNSEEAKRFNLAPGDEPGVG
jgi:hypothetical protein